MATGPADLPIEALAREHERSSFSSGAEELDRYLREQASQDLRRHVAAVFVAHEAHRVVGYYTLSATAIELSELPEDLAHRLPRYPQVPATLLGRLATDRSRQGRGLGERLLIDALFRSLASEIGSYAVVVDARDEAAARFYRTIWIHASRPVGAQDVPADGDSRTPPFRLTPKVCKSCSLGIPTGNTTFCSP